MDMSDISRREWFNLPIGALMARSGRPQDPRFQSEVRVLHVYAGVRQMHDEGRLELRKEMFTLEVDGQTQSIDYFDHSGNSPLSVAVLLDVSGSMRRILDREIASLRLFAGRILKGGKNEAGLLTFARGVTLARAFTAAPLTFLSSLNRVADTQTSRDDTCLFDAISVVSSKLMSNRPGRRAILVASDGVDTGSRASLDDAIEQAQRADTAVYALHVFDPNPAEEIDPSDGPVDRTEIDQRIRVQAEQGWSKLRRISERTGGMAWRANEAADSTLAELESELSNQCRFGFRLTAATATPGAHDIRITPSNPDLIVRAKDRYYVSR